MEDLKTLKGEIKYILTEHPETRDSDELLYANYLSRHGVGVVSVIYFLQNFRNYNVSDFESVTRCRRKLVEEHPELRPSKQIEELRYGRQVEIYDFVKGR